MCVCIYIYIYLHIHTHVCVLVVIIVIGLFPNQALGFRACGFEFGFGSRCLVLERHGIIPAQNLEGLGFRLWV